MFSFHKYNAGAMIFRVQARRKFTQNILSALNS